MQVRVLPDPPPLGECRGTSRGTVGNRWQGLRESFSQAATFVREAWGELRRVHWPSRREARTATFVVILVVSFVSVFLFVVDATLSRLLRAFLSN